MEYDFIFQFELRDQLFCRIHELLADLLRHSNSVSKAGHSPCGPELERNEILAHVCHLWIMFHDVYSATRLAAATPLIHKS